MVRWRIAAVSGAMGVLLATAPAPCAAQVQIRLGDPSRATYSEVHEGLREGTPAADSVQTLLRETRPAACWRVVREALADRRGWNDALLALTRLAELRNAAYADSARRLAVAIQAGKVKGPPGRDLDDLLSPLRAVTLERQRAVEGDAAVRRQLLAEVPGGDYGVAEVWVLGRMGSGTADTLAAHFLAAEGVELRVRWLTLLASARDTSQVALLARVYVAPDSFGVPVPYGRRASDGLLWIGTKGALAALRDARVAARARGTYADPRLARGGYGFLDNDSSAVISRTGRWLDEWLARIR